MRSLEHSPFTWVVLLGAALAGGGINSLAGGGMFMVFPALLFAGVAPVAANATASLALMPGAWASTLVYRDKLLHAGKVVAWGMAAASVAGSIIGSELLLHTSNTQFAKLAPWLMFLAALSFTFAGKIRALAASHSAKETKVAPLLAGQFFLAIYGGYFGAGLGVLMLALFILTSSLDIQTASGIRIMCGAIANLVAVLIFAGRGILDWHVGVPMLLCSILGGFVGAQMVKSLDPERARLSVLIYAWAITLWLLGRAYVWT
jgi:uncharacterized protein